MEEHWLHVLIKVMGLLLFTLAHYSDTINLNLVNFTEFSGPEGSYFGFSTDFYQFSNKTISVVVGAPKANTSQEGVTEGGAVYICPWSKTGGSCASITFDPKGDFCFFKYLFWIKSSKSHQWLGATVRSSGNYIVACAPLFHWNVVDVDERDEAQNTPVGGCLVMNTVTGGTAAFSPCRDFMTEKSYKENKYRDKLQCQASPPLPVSVEDYKSLCLLGHIKVMLRCPTCQLLQVSRVQVSRTTRWTRTVSAVWTVGKHNCISKMSCFPSLVTVTGHALYLLLLFQVSVFLQRERSAFLPRPDQKLTGSQMYGRFGSTVAALGDLDKDGFNDIAVGAPSSGVDGRVFIYMGTVDGLSPHYSQVIESPFRSKASPAQFGFTLRGSTDIDENGYPGWSNDSVAQAVIMAKTQLSLDPDFLNPDVKECELPSTIMMCISVSGHRIPEEIVLDAELQLDKMKQPTARRALLLQTNQPQERFQLTIQREEGVVCSNQTAYLLVKFKDKLSPMFISLNYDLSNSNSQEAVLHGQRATAVQTRIILDCGEDNICVPDLRLTAEAGTERLLIGDDHPALLVVVAENRGEGAYEAELEIRLPAKTHYQSMVVDKEGFSRLICAQKKDNQTMVVVCELGNPMKQGQKLQAGLFFSVGNLEEVESHVTFTLQMKSKNSQNPDSNAVHLRFKVSAAAALEMRGGSSPPECVLPIAKWEQKEQPADLEEVGPLVEHVYELRNLGPSPVNARVEVDFPTRNHGDFMLYVFANASEDFLTCYTDSPDIDPYQLSRNNTDAMLYKIKWNETTRPEPQRKQTIHVNCTSGDVCVRFVCEAAGLERGWSAVVKVMSRLWVQTFLERPYENYVLQSTARYQVTDMPSKIQPEELPSGWAETQTSVVWRAPDGEKEVPVWWIIVSVVSGLFLLGLLSFIFWKMGFFKRNRPPCDDDDDEAGQLAGTGQSEYAEMPTDTDNKKT
uniref:Uncharacterized protein n=1 Tax=Esox lucius TaxID=8010 RepID=A0A6Q2WP38_ESOLU